MKQEIEITDDQIIGIAMLGAFLTAYGSARGVSAAVSSVEDAVESVVSSAKGVDLIDLAKKLNQPWRLL